MDIGLIILILGLPLLAQMYINSSYNKYEKVRNEKNYTGFDTARAILDKNGLEDVLILETSGTLTDHYDPRRKVIKLSRAVYRSNSISAMSVAAHECGHAIQDKEGYTFLRIRSMLVPIVNITSNIGYICILLAFFAEAFDLLLVGVMLSMFGLVFQLVTLPVEFNASNRAKNELSHLNIARDNELEGVKNVLTSAALTYVAAMISNILQLFRYIMIFANNRRR